MRARSTTFVNFKMYNWTVFFYTRLLVKKCYILKYKRLIAVGKQTAPNQESEYEAENRIDTNYNTTFEITLPIQLRVL